MCSRTDNVLWMSTPTRARFPSRDFFPSGDRLPFTPRSDVEGQGADPCAGHPTRILDHPKRIVSHPERIASHAEQIPCHPERSEGSRPGAGWPTRNRACVLRIELDARKAFS